jgi:hypothetical protein
VQLLQLTGTSRIALPSADPYLSAIALAVSASRSRAAMLLMPAAPGSARLWAANPHIRNNEKKDER